MIRGAMIALVRLYQFVVSPMLPRSCRFFPSCSQYMIDALTIHGPIRGIGLGAKRILRCQPLCKGGFDFVPMPGEGPAPARPGRTWLALAVFAAGIFLFPMGSDAMLASDGVWYGIELEADPAKAIRGNHPLFHVAAWPVAGVLKAAGVPRPGHHALRVVAAAGAAVLVWLIAGLGGATAGGLAAAGYLAATRMFLVESSTGENVVPATAAALLATVAALRRRRLAVVGALFALALAMRQDNVFLAPGIALAIRPGGARAGPFRCWAGRALFLAAVAVLSALVYVAAWRIAAPGTSFAHYVLGLGAGGAWSPGGATFAQAAIAEGDALATAHVGRHWPAASPQPLFGLAALLLPLLLASTRRGWARTTWEPWLFGLPIVLRAVFYGWFEPRNPEWQLFAIAFSCAWAARFARLAGPRGFSTARTAAFASVAAVILLAHLPYTLALRKTTFRDAVADAVAAAPPGAVLAVEGFAAPAMLAFMGLPATVLQGSSEENLAKLQTLVAANEGKAVLGITDRFVLDAMPYSATHRAEHRGELDGYPDTERVRMLRRDGLAYAVLILPGK